MRIFIYIHPRRGSGVASRNFWWHRGIRRSAYGRAPVKEMSEMSDSYVCLLPSLLPSLASGRLFVLLSVSGLQPDPRRIWIYHRPPPGTARHQHLTPGTPAPAMALRAHNPVALGALCV